MVIPNFDGMNKDELMAFWSRYHRPSRKDAKELVGDTRKGYTNVAATLANYACNKAVAIGCRAKGDITAAQVYEKVAESCYERVPQDLRW